LEISFKTKQKIQKIILNAEQTGSIYSLLIKKQTSI